MCPPWLGCCVRLAGLVSQFVSHQALSFTLAGVLCPPRGACLLIPQTVYGWGSQCFLSVSALTGMLCPPRWSCLSLVCGLVSGLVCHLGWDAVSASLGCLRSCLPACLPSGLGCSVRLPALVSGLVSQLLSLFCLVACLSSGMLCSPSWLVSQTSLSPVFCPILFSSWSGVSVLWACLQNFMCDLCNCLGSTVV